MLNLQAEVKIGETLSMGVEFDEEKELVLLLIASPDVSASCAFRRQEWAKFCEVVKNSDKELFLGG